MLIKLYDKFTGQRGSFSLDDPNHVFSSSRAFAPTKVNVVAKLLKLAASRDAEIEKVRFSSNLVSVCFNHNVS